MIIRILSGGEIEVEAHFKRIHSLLCILSWELHKCRVQSVILAKMWPNAETRAGGVFMGYINNNPNLVN